MMVTMNKIMFPIIICILYENSMIFYYQTFFVTVFIDNCILPPADTILLGAINDNYYNDNDNDDNDND